MFLKHEPIIDKKTFDKVQNLIKANYHSNAQGEVKLLQGILFCHECQHRLQIAKCDKIGKDGTVHHRLYTQCTYYRKNRNLNVCTLHSNNYFKIEKNILNQLDDICKKFIKLVNYDKLTKEKTKTIKTYGTVLQEKIQLLEIDLRNLD